MKVIIIGAGGHSRVVYEILKEMNLKCRNFEIVAFVDNVIRGAEEKIMGIPVVGDHSVIPKLIETYGVRGFIVAVGDNRIRKSHYNKLLKLGLEPINAIHPRANIAFNAKIGRGVVVATGATITANATIGDNVIINTGAIIEHEDIIEDHVHIAPGAILAGRVTVKEGAFIGAGAVIKEYVTIGKNAVIGAGAVVLEDIPDNAVAVGVPARVVKFRNEE